MAAAELVCLSIISVCESINLNRLLNKQQHKQALLVGETRDYANRHTGAWDKRNRTLTTNRSTACSFWRNMKCQDYLGFSLWMIYPN